MAGDGDKKPWDGAVGAVTDVMDSASKSVRNTAADGVSQLKGLVGGNVDQVKDFFGANVEQGKELTNSARIAIKRVGKQAYEGLKSAVSPVVQIFERAESQEGTELRKQISSVRLQVNHQLHDVQLTLKDTQKATDEQLVPVRAALADTQKQLIKVNEFRREHPEAAVAGLVAVVGLPSLLLRGKIVAVRNVLVTVGGGAAVAYGTDRLAAKKK
uniref:Uncharacterized protein n=1 Tax=Globisporangium ultimum (strain ATCC 200006 / CBS 805.95 / DAOM BR144) TaxID=431595 RepID=K3WKL3_GLOUD